jgi:homoserine kinase
MKIEAFAPATMANIGPGFDVLGLAFADPADRVVAEWSETPGVTVAAIHGDGGKLSLDPARNTASVSAAHVLNQIGAKQGIRLTIYKGLPLASGMGSSSASAVAGAMAANAIFGSPIPQPDLLEACVEGEAVVSGRHADNVAPALFGGIVLVTGVTAETVIPLPTPPGLIFALVTPGVAVPTAEARAVLPKQVSLHDMVHQTGAVGRLVAAFCLNNIDLLARAMEEDHIVEPARAHLMPGLREVRAEAAKLGALATMISGAGPTLCTLCPSPAVAEQVSAASRAIYEQRGLTCQTRITTVGGGATARPLVDG